MILKRWTCLLLFCAFLLNPLQTKLFSEDWADTQSNLMKDLLIVEYWNNRLNERLPVYYNHLLQGGYFNMPSALMGCEGEVGFGFASVHPYRTYNLRCQLASFLEVSGNYRIYRGVDDPILSPLGFGDLSDKGANLKFAILRPEDSGYKLPGVAFGVEDFIGTKGFNSRYFVLTKVFLEQNLEISLGYGSRRIRRFFGGLSWQPFRKCGNPWLEGICLAAEYDATPYKDPEIERHPKGRKSKSPINFGIKYRLWDQCDFSFSCIRGHRFAFTASAYYNFGYSKGLVPKIDDRLPYLAPINVEPIGEKRPEQVVVQDLLFAMREQGFNLLEMLLYYDWDVNKVLRLRIYNNKYRTECQVREQLNQLITYLIPDDIDKVIVVVDSEGFSVQEYLYRMEYVRLYREKEIGTCELNVLSPLREVTCIESGTAPVVLFRSGNEWFNFELIPKTINYFGSSRGKFKYGLGLSAGFNGFLPGEIYYSVVLGYIAFSNLDHLSGIDRLNPSQLINVQTDVVRYYQKKCITVDEMYLQKIWNMGYGYYSRAALGYFEQEYAGFATEFLYYPLNGCWAVGIEGAVLKKRTFSGLGFKDKARKLEGFKVTHRKFLGYQGFMNFYYDWKEASVDFRIKMGTFLARDFGARFEISRYFPSGLRVTVWYTPTNGRDRINGKSYHDKGIEFSMPLDIFYTHADRSLWKYGLSAWQRDVGVISSTGESLYNVINDLRN
jgi:hypothetical protein